MTVCTLLDLFDSESNVHNPSWPESGNDHDGAHLQPESSSHLQIATEMMPETGRLVPDSSYHPLPATHQMHQPLLPQRLGTYTYSATQLSFSSLGLVPDQFRDDNIPPLSLDNAEPPPQLSGESFQDSLGESNVENTVGQPSGLYSCKGTWVQWLPGSVWDTYAYSQHELSHVTWKLAQINDDNNSICLKAKSCQKLLESDKERLGGTCSVCSAILTSSAFLKFINRASEESLPENMPLAYFNHNLR